MALHESWNFVIPAKKRECVFQDLAESEATNKIASQRVEVFVQSGGNLDVLLTIHGPLEMSSVFAGTFEEPLVKEAIDVIKETESDSQTFVTEFKPKSPGTYAFCLDNRSSRFLSKTVQFDVVSSLDNVDPIQLPVVDEQHSGDVDIARLKEYLHSLNTISKGITRVQQQQLRDRRRLSLHSDTNDTTYNEVFAGSIVETFIFISVSVFQIFFVRRWFVSKTSAKAKSWA